MKKRKTTKTEEDKDVIIIIDDSKNGDVTNTNDNKVDISGVRKSVRFVRNIIGLFILVNYLIFLYLVETDATEFMINAFLTMFKWSFILIGVVGAMQLALSYIKMANDEEVKQVVRDLLDMLKSLTTRK